MVNVLIVCEGQTEREFCRIVMAPHLATRGINFAGTLAGKPDKKRPGIGSWDLFRKEVFRLASKPGRHVGVFVDYYGMPKGWPGRQEASNRTIDERGLFVENALLEDASELSERFHPCVALHEYESLLFVQPEATALTLSVAEGCSDETTVTERKASLEVIKLPFTVTSSVSMTHTKGSLRIGSSQSFPLMTKWLMAWKWRRRQD